MTLEDKKNTRGGFQDTDFVPCFFLPTMRGLREMSVGLISHLMTIYIYIYVFRGRGFAHRLQ